MDMRTINRHNRPGARYWRESRGGRARLLAGDLWLTEAPPEFMAPASSRASPSRLSGARSRSPRRSLALSAAPPALPPSCVGSNPASKPSGASDSSSESSSESSSDSSAASSSDGSSDRSSGAEGVEALRRPLLPSCLKAPGAKRATRTLTWAEPLEEASAPPYPWDRLPWPFGSPVCDHCGAWVGEAWHQAYPFAVALKSDDLQAAQSACVCKGCKGRLLLGEALYLQPYEDYAEARFSRRRSRRQVLEDLGEPYTPKLRSKP